MAGAGTVCIDGDFFTVDSEGRLVLRVDGVASPSTWGYPCPVADNNGLHWDTDRGLWVAPPSVSAIVNVPQFAAPSMPFFPTSGSPVTVGTFNFDIVNPSTCFSADALCFIDIDQAITMAKLGNETLAMQLAWDSGDGGGLGGMDQIWSKTLQSTDINDLNEEHTDLVVKTSLAIPPGATRHASLVLSASGPVGCGFNSVHFHATQLLLANP